MLVTSYVFGLLFSSVTADVRGFVTHKSRQGYQATHIFTFWGKQTSFTVHCLQCIRKNRYKSSSSRSLARVVSVGFFFREPSNLIEERAVIDMVMMLGLQCFRARPCNPDKSCVLVIGSRAHSPMTLCWFDSVNLKAWHYRDSMYRYCVNHCNAKRTLIETFVVVYSSLAKCYVGRSLRMQHIPFYTTVNLAAVNWNKDWREYK